jgi:hypothetical protein
LLCEDHARVRFGLIWPFNFKDQFLNDKLTQNQV